MAQRRRKTLYAAGCHLGWRLIIDLPLQSTTQNDGGQARPTRSASTRSSSNTSSAANAACLPTSPVTEKGFLETFVKKIHLDPEWCLVLKNAGLTQEKLRVLAGREEGALKDLVDGLFPQMTRVDQFFFVREVKALAIAV